MSSSDEGVLSLQNQTPDDNELGPEMPQISGDYVGGADTPGNTALLDQRMTGGTLGQGMCGGIQGYIRTWSEKCKNHPLGSQAGYRSFGAATGQGATWSLQTVSPF